MKRLVPSAADAFGIFPSRFASFCILVALLFGAILVARAQTTNLPNLQFALYFHHDGAGFDVRGYTLQGPVAGGSLFPALRLTRAGDYSELFFGLDRHDLFKADPATGTRQSIDFADVSPQLAQQGWPTGLGFDHQRRQILLSSLGGEGYIHTYSETNGWRLLTSLKNWDVSDIAHHGPDDTIYVVQNSYISSGGQTSPLYVSRVGRDGAHGESILVGDLPFGVGYSDHYAELISVGGYLVLLLEPGRDTHDKGQPKESRIYLINPATGQSTLTYRANWSPAPPNQPPTVSITEPSNGAGFTAGDRVTLKAMGTDVDGFVQSLEFIMDGQSIGHGRQTFSGAGITFFELEWIATAGAHVITARATDHQGASGTSSGVTVSVQVPASFSLQFFPVGGIHLGRGGHVFTRTYAPSGPVEPGRLLPGMRVVPDGHANYFGTYWHNVYKIDSSGTVQNLTLPAGIEEFSWTMGVTFDTHRNRLLVVSLGGDGFLYSYSVASNSWSVVANMNNHDYNSLLYDAERDLIYAVENGKIQKLNSNGEIVGNISLPGLDLHLGPGSYQSEMALVGNNLALLIDPVIYNQIGAGQESRIYMIDLVTGTAQLTYRKVWPTMPWNQDPTVEIASPTNSSHFAFGTPVNLRAEASDADGEVLGVEFFDNGRSVGVAVVRNNLTGTFDILWTPDVGGSHTITANAVDNMGGIANARAITFTVHPPQPTVVRVRAIDAEATELPPDRSLDIAEFEVSLSGELQSDIRVQVSVHGSAVEGEDYQVVRKIVGIPAGSTRAQVSIAPISDSIAEKMETVVLRLEPAPTNTLPNFSYEIDPEQSEAAAVIYEREYPVHSTLELALPDDGENFETGEPIRVLAATAGFPFISTVIFKANGQQIGVSVHHPPSGSGQGFAIEAEDFDYDGGKHAPAADVMPYAGGAYDGFGALHNVDYARANDVTEGNVYRTGESPNVPMFNSPETTNRNRGSWEIETNYRVGWMDDGTWFNYTRNFPPGAYRIFAGLAHGDASATMRAALSQVTSGQGTMFQNVQELGQFTAPATGNWNNTTRVPLTQNGAAVQVQLGGEQTLRFQGRAGDFDYLLLEPAGVVAPPRLVWHNSMWTNAPQGTHIITAEALLPSGELLTSSSVQITVGSNQPPSFIRRELPEHYIAGTAFIVVLNATPPLGTLAYAAEDIPPVGWNVSGFSHGGVFDTATGKVKFGPFTDGEPRALTYRITPPSNASGTAEFSGSASRNGVLFSITGDRVIQGGTQFHPADQDRNNVITIMELTAYAAAWKVGKTWPIAPSSIPASYVTRAASIWKRGEAYVFNGTVAAPFCWSPATAIQPSFVESRNLSLIAAQRINVANVAPGATAVVEIRATPSSGSTAYAVEETVPPGWTVSELGDGIFDPASRRIRWGPFLDSNPRNLAYQITAPGGVASSGRLAGIISMDGNDVAIFGAVNRIVATDETTAITLIPRMNGSAGIELGLSCAPGQSGVVEYSTDLQNWTTLQSISAPNGSVEISDVAALGVARFYRLRID